jgi:hypothetical protein
MISFDWLSQHSFQSLIHREHDWVIVFDAECSLTVWCLWRFIENGRIRITSEDHNQQFGLPAPVDACAHMTTRLANHAIVEVNLREETLDMHLNFDDGCVLEIIPDSSGYEAWSLQRQGQQWIAQGGGNLMEFKA